MDAPTEIWIHIISYIEDKYERLLLVFVCTLFRSIIYPHYDIHTIREVSLSRRLSFQKIVPMGDVYIPGICSLDKDQKKLLLKGIDTTKDPEDDQSQMAADAIIRAQEEAPFDLLKRLTSNTPILFSRTTMKINHLVKMDWNISGITAISTYLRQMHPMHNMMLEFALGSKYESYVSGLLLSVDVIQHLDNVPLSNVYDSIFNHCKMRDIVLKRSKDYNNIICVSSPILKVYLIRALNEVGKLNPQFIPPLTSVSDTSSTQVGRKAIHIILSKGTHKTQPETLSKLIKSRDDYSLIDAWVGGADNDSQSLSIFLCLLSRSNYDLAMEYTIKYLRSRGLSTVDASKITFLEDRIEIKR